LRLSHLCALKKGLFKFSNRQRAADSSAEFKKPSAFYLQTIFYRCVFSCEFQFPRNLNSARYVNRWKSSRKNILSQWSTVHEQFNQGEK
jgi:hypothetical protein